MAVLGVGMGLIVSQLGNVVQSSVDASGRGEAGGLQYTGQQLGSSLGVALIGAIVLAGLTGAFVTNVQSDARIAPGGRRPGRACAVEPGSTSSPSAEVEAAARAGRARRRDTRPPSPTTTSRPSSWRSRPACWRPPCSPSHRLAFTTDLPRSIPAGQEVEVDGDAPEPAAA